MRSLGLIAGLWLLGSSSALALENGLPVVEASPSIECAGGLRIAGGTAPLAMLHAAAERGDVVALSTLGCMYAKGDGVKPNPLRAFGYFDRIAHEHEDDPPDHPQDRKSVV